MKKIVGIVLSLVLIVTFAACSKDEQANTQEPGKDVPVQVEKTEQPSNEGEDKEVNENNSSSQTKMGKTFSDGQLNYNVLGVRATESNDYKYLIIKLEVYNEGSEDINFSSFDRLTVYGGETECSLDLFASVEADLSGTITPSNKIMGEVAFDITDSSSDDYVLHIGKEFEYTPAIEINAEDIGAVFSEQFDASGVKSEYSIGVPVESKQLSILLNGASVISSDKEGKEILLLDISVTNNDSEPGNFMLGINFNGAYSADGVQLDTEYGEWTLGVDMASQETINGIASFYIDEGSRDFYITVTPDLNKFSDRENIVFTVE